MKIGIYGGSFNPIHKGHVKIAKQAIEELGLDKLFFVPAFKSPFKTKNKYAPIEDRIEMIKMVLPEKSDISLFEANRKGVSYTIDTVSHFNVKYPNDELFLIIGSDNVYKLNKWKKIDDIAKMAQIVVFKREGDFSKENIKKYNCKLLNNPLYDYASSWFRKGYMDNVEDNVMEYIASKYLYVTDILLNMVDAKRHKHSIATGALAAKYAKQLDVNPKDAWFAGTMHDITKGMPKTWHREYLESKGVDETQLEDYQLHSLSAYYWLKDEYKLKNEEILNAIRVHTSLEKELSNMDKLVYAADKLAEGRKFEGIQTLRIETLKEFDKGFKKLVGIIRNHILELRGSISDEQEAIYKEWM